MKMALTLFALGCSAAAAMAQDVYVKQAYVPLAPPGMMTHVAYMTLENTSDEVRSLIGVKAAGYGMAHVHLSAEKYGVATMSMVHQLDIAPGTSVALAPGSFHIMLMHPKAMLTAGDVVALELQFANGEAQDVLAKVKARDTGS